MLFTLYIADVGKLIEAHGVLNQTYADNCQVYLATTPNDLSTAKDIDCTDAIRKWMLENSGVA